MHAAVLAATFYGTGSSAQIPTPGAGSDSVQLRLATDLGAPGTPGDAPLPDTTSTRLALALQLTQPVAGAAMVPSTSLTQIVINLLLNGIPKGDFVAYLGTEGDILLAARELVDMGVPHPEGRMVTVDGETYLSLKSIAGAKFNFNEKTLTLDLRLPPSMLPAEQFDEGAKLPKTAVQRRDPGGFFNYGVSYTHTQDAQDAVNVTTETGVNLGDWLLLDNHSMSNTNMQERSVRLQSQLIYDQPDDLRRWIVGDTFASSGNLGSSLNLGGISVSKLYQINPYLVKTPLAAVAGAVTLPSTVDVYMDGARVLSQNVAPGNFNLQNLNSYNATGLRNVDIVIRDAFGNEQHIGFPYFFTDQLLAAGLQEYSYNLGFLRDNYGLRSFDYGAAALSAFHRYGVNNNLTIGAGIDATRNHVNMDPRFILNTVAAGIVGLDVSYSHDRPDGAPSQSGRAASLSHTYVAGPLSSQILVQRYSQDYTVLGLPATSPPKLQASAGISYGGRDAGTWSVNYSVGTVYGGLNDQHTTTLGYTKTLLPTLSLMVNVGRQLQGAAGYTAFIGLSYFSANGHQASASHQRFYTGDTSDQLQVAKTPPIGEGFGYRVIAERNVTAGVPNENVSPFVQYNTRDAIFIAQGTDFVNGTAGASNFYQLSAAGAVAVIGGGAYLSRPINDSFGLVKLDPPLAGVRVSRSNSQIGITDADGKVFVPVLGSYQANEVEVEPKDIPLDYSVAQTAQKIRPPFRSGEIAVFRLKKVRAIIGTLKLRRNGELAPLENVDLKLVKDAVSVPLSTVREGSFYIENLAPGRYTAQLKIGEKACRLELNVPDSAEIVADLGDVICETTD
jgi:outer membrane usher protein FimD/PapC